MPQSCRLFALKDNGTFGDLNCRYNGMETFTVDAGLASEGLVVRLPEDVRNVLL